MRKLAAAHQRIGSLDPSPQRIELASVFGKSSGFESYRGQVPGLGPLDFIKQRLAYEWKNIYRSLAQVDIEGKGKVATSDFQASVSKNRVYMTREEFKKL